MPKVKSVRALPWIVVLEAAMAVRDHWQRLTPAERSRVTKLIKKSQGRPANLTKRERDDLKRLARKLDPAGLGRRLMPLGRRTRGGGRLHRS